MWPDSGELRSVYLRRVTPPVDSLIADLFAGADLGRRKAVGGQEDLIEEVALHKARQRG